MKTKDIRKKVIDKIQLFLDLNNGKNKLQKQLGWGPYVYYRYLHSEEYFEEMATFDNKEDAETFLQSEIKQIMNSSANDTYPWEENEVSEDAMEYFRLKEWDLPIRRYSCEKWSITLGLADAHTFVRTMPVEMALDLFEQFFYSRVIPGYYEEH